MARTQKTTTINTERTSSTVASIAGSLLNGTAIREAEDWLQELAVHSDPDGSRHASVLLGVLENMRRVAASALTQRG